MIHTFCMENDVLMRCTNCYSEFTFEELKSSKECPDCGTTVPPHPVDQDVLLYINWQELRALTIPAMQWYNENRDQIDEDVFNAIDSIINRINESKPIEDADELTLAYEEDVDIEVEEQDILAIEKVEGRQSTRTFAEYTDLFVPKGKRNKSLPN